MSLLKYVERLKRMDDLIRRRGTGTPEEFANRLGLGRSVLMDELRELKELGARISYCRERQSYFYEQEFIIRIGNLETQEKNKIRGGENSFDDLFRIRYYRTDQNYFGETSL